MALFARNDAGFVECMRSVTIFAFRRSSMKCRFARRFFMTNVTCRGNCRIRFFRMRIVARRARLPFGIRMFRFDRGMTLRTRLGWVFPDIMWRMTRIALRVLFISAARHRVQIGMARCACLGFCIGRGMSVMT